MFSTSLSSRFSGLLFRASKLKALIDSERRHTPDNGLRLMRLNSLRLRVLASLYATLQDGLALRALQPVPVLVRTQRQSLPSPRQD